MNERKTAKWRRDVTRRALRRALTIELGRSTIDRDVATLATPRVLQSDVAHYMRGMSREDAVACVGHMALLARMFAYELPAERRAEMLASLDTFDSEVDRLQSNAPLPGGV